MKILHKPENKPTGIRIIGVGTAYNLFVNSNRIFSGGVVGKNFKKRYSLPEVIFWQLVDRGRIFSTYFMENVHETLTVASFKNVLAIHIMDKKGLKNSVLSNILL